MYKGMRVRIEMVREGVSDKGQSLKSPEEVAEFLSELKMKDREHFVVICVDVKCKVLCVNICSIGSLNASGLSLVKCLRLYY
jgi:DNA repair protein RadC